MPGFSVFAAAAQVGLGVDDALFEQGDEERVEVGLAADVEAAIGGQVAGIGSVQGQALFVDDEHRDLGLVLAFIEDLLGLVFLGIELDFGLAEDLRTAGGDVVFVDGRGAGEGGKGVKDRPVVAPAAEAAGRAQGGHDDLADEPAVEAVLEGLGIGVLEVRAEKLSAGRAGAP